MKKISIILAFFISINGFCQVKSGDTQNGEGQYQYSNGAVYTGHWKNGKRHGKGVMIYPKGASEANTKKMANDTTCICSNWTPDALPATEEKIWTDIGMNVLNLALSEMNIVEVPDVFYRTINSDNSIRTVFNPGNYMNAYFIIDLVLNEQYKQAAEKTSDWALGYMFPAIAAYKGLIDASILTGQLIIENWEQDLYLMPIYQKVDELMAKEIRKGDREFNAYLFSGYVHKNPELRKKMSQREEFMFNEWEKIYGFDMYISQSTVRGVNSFSRIISELQKKYSPGTVITNRMIFNHFMWLAANDHRNEMVGIFQGEMEMKAEEQAQKLKKIMIKTVCEHMNKKK